MKIELRSSGENLTIEFSEDFKELFNRWIALRYEEALMHKLSQERKANSLQRNEGIDLRAQARSQKMVDDAKKKEIEKQQENERKAAEYDKTVASQKLNPPPEKPKTDFPDDETFAKLPFEEMEALLTGGNLTEFRVAAFARATEAKFPGKAKALAFDINPKDGFQGIKKDKLQMALFVQRIKDRNWVKAEEDDIPF